ncbi:MAG: NAD+ synthase [Bdellovibrionota bacterium]
MRIALLQMRSIVGQIQWNCSKVKAALDRAQKDKIDLVVTPELALLGYPCDDLLSFQFTYEKEQSALKELQAYTQKTGVALLVGHTEKTESSWFYNCASLFESGQCLGTIRKERLPSYNIFNEARQFIAFSGTQPLLSFRGKKLGISICEDDWDEVNAYGSTYPRKYPCPGPAFKDERSQCDIHINLSASPFESSKAHTREKAFEALATKMGKPFLWVNRVGAQDAAIFDGQSSVYDPKLCLQAKSFEEDFLVWDESLPAKKMAHNSSDWPQLTWSYLENALCLGIRDFIHQSGSQKVLLGLSGGIDSSCVAALCAQALGPENVTGVSLPSNITSELSKQLAKEHAKKLGIHFKEISIEKSIETLSKEAELSPGTLAYENIQSRIRGVILMAESNSTGALVMACGNKSEYATGYGTLYGDIAGALAPIGDLFKSEVYGLCHFMNRNEKVFADELLARPPTAELAHNQKDTDSLPHYAILDAFLYELLERQGHAFIDRDWSTFLRNTTAPELLKKVLGSEFKRFQAPPILRVSNWAFGKSWSMPIATKT